MVTVIMFIVFVDGILIMEEGSIPAQCCTFMTRSTDSLVLILGCSKSVLVYMLNSIRLRDHKVPNPLIYEHSSTVMSVSATCGLIFVGHYDGTMTILTLDDNALQLRQVSSSFSINITSSMISDDDTLNGQVKQPDFKQKKSAIIKVACCKSGLMEITSHLYTTIAVLHADSSLIIYSTYYSHSANKIVCYSFKEISVMEDCTDMIMFNGHGLHGVVCCGRGLIQIILGLNNEISAPFSRYRVMYGKSKIDDEKKSLFICPFAAIICEEKEQNLFVSSMNHRGELHNTAISHAILREASNNTRIFLMKNCGTKLHSFAVGNIFSQSTNSIKFFDRLNCKYDLLLKNGQ